jgi:hypothetical protein
MRGRSPTNLNSYEPNAYKPELARKLNLREGGVNPQFGHEYAQIGHARARIGYELCKRIYLLQR